MYSILIIEQNRGNFLGKKLLLCPTADKEAKNKQRAGEKAKKEMHPRQHAVELFGKKATAVPNRWQGSQKQAARSEKSQKNRCTRSSEHPPQQLKNINYQV